jgi:4-hydroxy-tetrahydrodipicolinate reductase
MTDSLRIAIPGAAGRMGQLLVGEVLAADDLTLVAASDAPGHPRLGDDVGAIAGASDCGVTLTDDLGAALAQAEAQVVIDFTVPALTDRLAGEAAAAGCKLVIGTTGLDAAQREAVTRAAEQVAVVFAPNTSVGVNVMLELVSRAVELLGPSFDLELVEAHHKHKKDAPSGTALRIAEVLAEASAELGSFEQRACYGRRGVDPRQQHQIGIHTVRGGDVAGEHVVHFLGEGERLAISHSASSRQTFARGAVRAARWVAEQAIGLYDMQHVLGLRSR